MTARPRRSRTSMARRAGGAQPRHLPARAGIGDWCSSTDRSIVVERFRDEIGDWRVCVLTPFGGRARALAMALAHACGTLLTSTCGRFGRTTVSPRTSGRRRAHLLPICLSIRMTSKNSCFEHAQSALTERGSARTPRVRSSSHDVARPADTAVAAAAQGAEPAPGRATLSPVPDRTGDLSRVPPGRLRPAGAPRDPARHSDAPARSGRGRDAVCVAVRLFSALRVRGHVHVRGRHAARGAARAGALPRPRAPA